MNQKTQLKRKTKTNKLNHSNLIEFHVKILMKEKRKFKHSNKGTISLQSVVTFDIHSFADLNK